ncbi:tRNA pseudouridine(38-40) synthase TruA [Rhabdochromatium marinum]|uniref:tRNA pseudouridine(38-40) synthase TruA n=1 Tax=Rhabdochromatium marinum TaxID=48729 RepID=UPI001905680F|nr:tRNA pseudouridine(38-40) synthase TruA [Rhabdochromatium marinum]MBK1649598.1 tRNA pseudouridine(38-40) synthase TruA [Rhabdochromatium marinum]
MAESPKARIALGIEYDGSHFHGWQMQHHAPSVQEAVQRAASRVADQPVVLHCAGRTDAGVHGLGQVAHFDSQARRTERSWVLGINSHLPPEIAVRWAREMPADFHARFSACARHYRYLIINRPTRPALLARRAVWIHRPLDLERMRAAGPALLGTHDFSSFRAQGCQAKSPVRTLHYLQLDQQGELIELAVGADGFLHHMVRNLAGVLLSIGRGEAEPEWTQALLSLRDRAQGGVTAPPQGLYLTAVDYPEHYQVPTANGSLLTATCA